MTAALAGRSASSPVTVRRREIRCSATVVGSVIRSGFASTEVWVHPNGKVAYLGTALGGDRLYTIDVSDPANPRIVDSVRANTRGINDIMTAKEGKVMVFTRENAADRKNGIVIATLEDPLHPRVVAEFTEGVTAGVHSAFIYTRPRYGTHVYLTNDGTGAVHVVDINDPGHPKQVGLWKTPRADAGRVLHDIDVQDGLLYASYWHDGLVILDVGKGIKGGSPTGARNVAALSFRGSLGRAKPRADSPDGAVPRCPVPQPALPEAPTARKRAGATPVSRWSRRGWRRGVLLGQVPCLQRRWNTRS